MTLLRIDASILGPNSAGSELADLVVAEWAAERPDEKVVVRHLAANPLPSDAWAIAATAGYTPADQQSDAQKAAVALGQELRAELDAADAIVLASPLYNFGISQHIKVWLDLVLTASSNPAEEVLKGKPVIVLSTHGGNYAPGTPREGWDHGTPYLRRVLSDVWKADLTVIEREFTLVGVNPALDEFLELGAQLKKGAIEAAVAAGKAIAKA